jgi:hypothetical protein
MLAKIYSAAVYGVDAYEIEIEVNGAGGDPNIVIVGMIYSITEVCCWQRRNKELPRLVLLLRAYLRRLKISPLNRL